MLNNQNWNLYLVGDDNVRHQFSASIRNKEGFYVFSIDLSKKFKIGGYVVESESNNGEIKQVAGIQVINSSIKSLTSIPNELFIVLFGFSLFIFSLILYI